MITKLKENKFITDGEFNKLTKSTKELKEFLDPLFTEETKNIMRKKLLSIKN